jgi:hypothetical protein
VVGIRPQLLLSPTTEQGGREGDILTRGNVERDDLERGPLLLPFEERRPRLAVGLDAAHLVRRRHVEHLDVFGVIGEHAVEIAGVHRRRPAAER